MTRGVKVRSIALTAKGELMLSRDREKWKEPSFPAIHVRGTCPRCGSPTYPVPFTGKLKGNLQLVSCVVCDLSVLETKPPFTVNSKGRVIVS